MCVYIIPKIKNKIKSQPKKDLWLDTEVIKISKLLLTSPNIRHHLWPPMNGTNLPQSGTINI